MALLKSLVAANPDVPLELDKTITIGRNKLCRIQDIRCPKESRTVTLVSGDDGLKVRVTDCKTNEEQLFGDDEKIEGPGFSYQIEIASLKEPPTKKLKTSNEEVVWTFDAETKVHVGHYLGGGPASARIAAFDFDGTLSVPKSTSKFPKDGKDFKLWSTKLPERISSLEPDQRLVIFSNQRGIFTKNTKLVHVQERIVGILKLFDQRPCLIMLAEGDNYYRKPRPGMFELLRTKYNDGVQIDLSQSFYVGDAAGRKTKTHKDHSSCDLAFAFNLGLPFLTPEQFIAKEDPLLKISGDLKLPAFDPKAIREAAATSKFGIELCSNKVINDLVEFQEQITELVQKETKLIMLNVGMPASGKSLFFNRILEPLKFTRISRDQLKTMELCEKEAKKLLGRASTDPILLAIDNTNHDLVARKRWLSIAKQHNAKLVALWLNMDREHCLHNNTFRKFTSELELEHASKAVPSVVIYKQAKEWVAPTPKEGFSKVYRLNFKPQFESEQLERLYYMFLFEK